MLFGNLSLFLLRVIDRSQLDGRTILLIRDGRIEHGKYLVTNESGGVESSCLGIRMIFGQQIELDVVECQFHAPIAQCLVQIAVVICRLCIAVGSHQIVVGINLAGSRLGIVRLEESLIGLGGLSILMKPLQGHGPHDLNTSLILVEILTAGIRLLLVLAQQHLRTIDPVDGLCIALGVDISHTGIDRTDNSFLKTTTRRVRLPTGCIMLTGSEETLIGLFVAPEVQLTAADIVQEDGIVDIGANARFLHLGHSGHGHHERTLIIATNKQEF